MPLIAIALSTGSTRCLIPLAFEPRREKTCLQGSPTRSDTNLAVQPQKMTGSFKFRISEVVGLYYLCGENKGAAQLCAFVFAYAKSRFSHDVAHLKRMSYFP